MTASTALDVFLFRLVDHRRRWADISVASKLAKPRPNLRLDEVIQQRLVLRVVNGANDLQHFRTVCRRALSLSRWRERRCLLYDAHCAFFSGKRVACLGWLGWLHNLVRLERLYLT